MNDAARYQPGARSRADISRTTSSLRRIREELHERIDLRAAQGTPVVGGHDPLGEALRDLRVGLDDRLLDERRVLALQDLVEVGAGRAVRARRRQRVARAAGRRAGAVLAVREQRLRVGRGGLTAAAATTAAPAGGRARAAHPGGELRLRHHVRRLAHERVAQAAQLGADDLVGAERRALRRDAVARRDAGHRVDLHPEVRDPEVVDDVLGLDLELHRLVHGQVQLGAPELPAALVVLEGPGELLAEDLDDPLLLPRRQGGRLLDVAQDDVGVDDEADDEDRRDRGPDHLDAGVAVDRRAVEALLARPHAEVEDREADHRRHQHEHRHRRDEQDVPQRVDLVRLRGRGGREPVDRQAERDAQDRRDDADDGHLRRGPPGRAALGRDLRDLGFLLARVLLSHGGGILCEPCDGRQSGAGPRSDRASEPERGVARYVRYAASRVGAASATASKRERLRYVEGETAWWRRNALANWAGWR